MRRARVWLGVAVVAFAVVVTTSALGASADSAARARATTDLPDEISGAQVHFMYVVPADGVDGQLDTNGAMEESIARIEHWFERQAGNQGLRVDTYNGVPDITFVRMPHTGAQATATNPWPLWVMGEDLVAAGFNDQAKVVRGSLRRAEHVGLWRCVRAGAAEAGRHVPQGVADRRPRAL